MMDSAVILEQKQHQRRISSFVPPVRPMKSCWRMTLLSLMIASVKSTRRSTTSGLATAFIASRRLPSTSTSISLSCDKRIVSSFLWFGPRFAPTVRRSLSTKPFPILSLSSTDTAATVDESATSGTSSPSGTHLDDQSETEATVKTPSTFVGFPFYYHELIDVQIEKLTNRGWGVARFDVSDRKPDTNALSKPGKSKRGRTAAAVAHDTENLADENGEETEFDSTVQAMLDETSPATSTSTGSDTDTSSFASKRWVIMVPNVIPGEFVRVRIFRNFKNYSEGDLVQVLVPSPDRVSPKCAVADDCGGCQLQHMAIAAQRTWKTESVVASLAQYGIHTTVSPTLGTDETFGYRSKITPHYQAPAKRKRGGRNAAPEINPPSTTTAKNIQAIGFQRQTSRSIIDVRHCPIATPAVNAKYTTVRDELLSQPSTKTKGATLLFRQANVGVSEDGSSSSDVDSDVSTNHQEYLTTRVRGLDFTYQAGNFFQNNYFVLPLMVDLVVQHASELSAATVTAPSGRRMTHLVDCYCGSGLFALSASAVFDTVVGIEINARAVDEASANAARNQITNCQFRAAPSEAIFTDIQDYPRDSTVVVLDPPRKGCSADFLSQLEAFAPQRIVYMSCDPTTQARDAESILATQRYRITSVQPFDLFPQTRHIECLVIFERSTE